MSQLSMHRNMHNSTGAHPVLMYTPSIRARQCREDRITLFLSVRCGGFEQRHGRHNVPCPGTRARVLRT